MTPSECEACFYLTDNFGHGHTVLCWSHVAEKDRQLAEARELIKQLHESGEWMRGMAEEGSPLDLLTKRAEDFLARAALAPKEGK